jgi:hypothetical protein
LFLFSENGNHFVIQVSFLLHHECVHAAAEVLGLEAIGSEKLFRKSVRWKSYIENQSDGKVIKKINPMEKLFEN